MATRSKRRRLRVDDDGDALARNGGNGGVDEMLLLLAIPMVATVTEDDDCNGGAVRLDRRWQLRTSGRRSRRRSGDLRWKRRTGRGRRRLGEPGDGFPERRRRLEQRRDTAGLMAATAAQELSRLGRYERRRAKARVAAERGYPGDPFIEARRRRRRPTATGGEKERLGFGRERGIRFEIESGTFQTKLVDASKRE
nr:retrotransposon protein, putative, Ty3-gypsy subclass [Oryza sativa Japonica Group]